MTDTKDKIPVAGKIALGVVGGMIAFGIIGAFADDKKEKFHSTPSLQQVYVAPVERQTFAGWKAQFDSVYSQAQIHWANTSKALESNNQTAATTGFALLSQDGANISALSNSPDPSLNNYINKLGDDYFKVAQVGSSLINNGSTSMEQLQSSIDVLSVDEDQLGAMLSGSHRSFEGEK